jgi:hypothetical protein
MNGMPELLVVVTVCAGLPFLFCAALAAAGRVRFAWMVPAAILCLWIVLAVGVTVVDRHGQAGLAAVLISAVVFVPALVGGVAGGLVGWIAARLTGRRAAGGEQR